MVEEIKLEDLARQLNGELVGGKNLTVRRIEDIDNAREGDLAFIFRKRDESSLENAKATCAVVPQEVAKARIPVIRCKNPNLAFKKAVETIFKKNIPGPSGVSKAAYIGKDVKLGKGVAIGAFAVIEDNASIGSGSVIYGNAYIGESARIGENAVIYPNVTVRENVSIGNRVIIHSGSVVGADGFGYERTEKGHEKIPHMGSVIIEDDVELGACVTVDRAKISYTKIGKGTKIDNLVQIAHNVTIGQHCILVAQCGISGSVKIGNNVIMGGKVGVADHVEIGDNVMIAANAGIMKSVPPNTIMWGLPARPYKRAKTIYALFDKLPELYERLKIIEGKLGIK